jgi:hypothetical protein
VRIRTEHETAERDGACDDAIRLYALAFGQRSRRLFPDWILCIAGSVLLAIVVYRVLKVRGHEAWMYPLAVTSPAFVVSMPTCAALRF